jgi:tetratricopeptide (TPR) repeat protein
MSTQIPNDNNHRMLQIRQMLASTPNDCFLLHALALEHVKINQDAMAKTLFEQVLQTDENYIGSYYHLGKLLERNEANDEAIATYEKGIAIAKKRGDRHSQNELQGAIDFLL